MPHKIIELETANAILAWAEKNQHQIRYEPEKHKIYLETAMASLRLPFQATYLHNRLVSEDKNWVLIMVRAGIASAGYFELGENLDHKVFRAYMVRKKQGKSQIKYLKTKGKSRAGSRVRLAETDAFFKDINQRVGQYLNEFQVDHIGLSISKTLWPFLFNDKSENTLKKNDPRLIKIPKHVQNPTYESLIQVNLFLQRTELIWEKDIYPPLADFIATTNKKIDHEDW